MGIQPTYVLGFPPFQGQAESFGCAAQHLDLLT